MYFHIGSGKENWDPIGFSFLKLFFVLKSNENKKNIKKKHVWTCLFTIFEICFLL